METGISGREEVEMRKRRGRGDGGNAQAGRRGDETRRRRRRKEGKNEFEDGEGRTMGRDGYMAAPPRHRHIPPPPSAAGPLHHMHHHSSPLIRTLPTHSSSSPLPRRGLGLLEDRENPAHRNIVELLHLSCGEERLGIQQGQLVALLLGLAALVGRLDVLQRALDDQRDGVHLASLLARRREGGGEAAGIGGG
eukprot:3037518-Pyramimonas_sp.AAC.1